jgi:hypothetical protein
MLGYISIILYIYFVVRCELLSTLNFDIMDLLKKLETDSEYLWAINSLSITEIVRITRLSLRDATTLKRHAYKVKLTLNSK